jgi:anti-sigma regulatory factor (Ser/Thr protein kinase)
VTGGTAPARWTFPAQNAEVGAARDESLRILTSWGFDTDREGPGGVFKLLVSEVVTNAVRHGGTEGDLTAVMLAEGDMVTFAVRDSNPDAPARAPEVAGSLPLGGRGMFLIEAMADASGWHPAGDGKLVWFQLRLPVLRGQAIADERTDGSRHTQLRALGTRIREMRPRQHIRPLAVAS